MGLCIGLPLAQWSLFFLVFGREEGNIIYTYIHIYIGYIDYVGVLFPCSPLTLDPRP